MSKTIVVLNLGNFGSTGSIARSVLDLVKQNGVNTFFAYAGNPQNQCAKDDEYQICSVFFTKLFKKLAYYSGLNGMFAVLHTIRLCYKMECMNVGLIHFHNLHNSYVNLPLLFAFIKRKHIPVLWTLHDCWSFTGRCPHFVMAKCNKWKNGCCHCEFPQRDYPQAFFDMTRFMWHVKRSLFQGLKNCIIVTPSQWLADLVKQSYLKDYPVKVINNGVDLSVFKPTQSTFREHYGLLNKKIVLGVAFDWGNRKGLDVFIELANRLPNNYSIVLVGTDNCVDKQLPSSIISIHRTQNQVELAEIYTAADVFANPTREENYPTVNMEAIACGSPVVTFRTGGSPEILDKTCGSVVDCDDIDAMEIEIRRICEERPYSKEACLERAKSFDMNARFEEYVNLYKKMTK